MRRLATTHLLLSCSLWVAWCAFCAFVACEFLLRAVPPPRTKMGKKDGDRPLPQVPDAAPPAAEQFDMVFHCQLAHGSPTRQVRDFTNVKQLYESIAKAFAVKTADVCCWLWVKTLSSIHTFIMARWARCLRPQLRLGDV